MDFWSFVIIECTICASFTMILFVCRFAQFKIVVSYL